MMFLRVEIHELRSASHISRLGSWRKGMVDVFKDQRRALKVNSSLLVFLNKETSCP